jgi:superfamily II DNA or RNA helicase
MSNIFDNISQQTLEGLLGALSNPNAKRADFCVGYFNLRGWKELVDAVEHLPGEKIVEDEDEVFRTCRLIVGMHSEPLSEVKRIYRKVSEGGKMDNATANLLRTQMALEFRKQLTVGVPTNEDEMGLKKLISQLKSGKLVVKLYLESPLHAKLYIVHEDHHSLPATSILGSSNLTLSGLRFQKELNYQTNQKGDNELLIDWFNARWEEQYCIDISKELIEVLENSWASEVPLAPYYIYLFMIYNLCEEARLGAAQYEIPSTFKSILFPYQEAAVKLAAKKLDNRGGVLLGDVVGLGKTMTACAILKMYEAFEDRYALVICPPKLVDMWNQYRKDFDIKIDVISSGSIDTRSMEKLKPYKTVVIDESHNFRNQEGMRYKALRSYLLDNAEKTILLTATPYNKSYLDISGQLKLFIQEDKQLGISPETLIAHLGGIDEFITQHGDIDPQTILAFEESLYSADWQELMRRYMIRRTRSFIKEVHCKRDEDRNRFYLPHQDGSRSYFPERLARRVLFKIDPADPFDIYAGLYSRPVVDSLNQLHLPRYGLSTYIQEKEAEKASKEQARILEDLSKAGGRMRGFARTNLMKRLESSGHAFLLSLYRHALRNHIFAYAIDNGLDIPIGNSSPFDMDDYLEDNDPALFVVDEEQEKVRIYPFEEAFFKERAQKAYSMLANKSDRYYRYYRWIDPRFFTPTLKTNLLQDAKAIRALIEKGHHWNAEKDAKFDALVNLICETHPNEKMVIFSQFADTVEKINERLVASGLENVDWITGSHGEQYTVVGRFSPKSNRYHMGRHEKETRVLLTSDVLSEGQNLQDAHIVVNFDLPWAIIRLIQRRAGLTVSDKMHRTCFATPFSQRMELKNLSI